jgi:hypothetical protein
MNLTLNILSAFLILALSFRASPAKKGSIFTKTAVLKFETETIDYETIQQHSDGKRTFTFTNKGEAPLVISQVKTSCGCTVANYTKAPILPGKTGEIEVVYDTKRLGTFHKSITVMSNAEETQKILRIKGVIVATE